MVRTRSVNVAVLFVIADLALGKVVNETINLNDKLEVKDNKLPLNVETRRKEPKHRSTSSSSGELPDKGDPGESLDMSEDSTTSEEGVVKKKSKNKYAPVSSAERPGWRKWHRKCVRCPEDMEMKWRDPSIDWICGAYQDARRSFKSACMMRYRNCQDGTMFVKIHDHRCADDAARGDHFFYDYVVKLSGESSKTEDSSYDEPSQDIDY